MFKQAFNALARWNHRSEEYLMRDLNPIERQEIAHLRGWAGYVVLFKLFVLAYVPCALVSWFWLLGGSNADFFWLSFGLAGAAIWIGLSLWGIWFGSSKWNKYSRPGLVARMLFFFLASGIFGYLLGAHNWATADSWSDIFVAVKLAKVASIMLGMGFVHAALTIALSTLRKRDFDSQDKINNLKLAAEINECALAKSQLRNLQAQIEPHFLFNTLTLLHHEIGCDPNNAQALLNDLVKLLRELTKSHDGSDSTVERELNVVQAYLSIMKKRMGSRLEYQIEANAASHAMSVPPGVLLTLVENAVKHGIEPCRMGGQITITAQIKHAGSPQLRLEVKDTGVGISSVPGTGIGLSNIRQQLMAKYGDQAQLEAEPLFDAQEKPCGFSALVWINQS